MTARSGATGKAGDGEPLKTGKLPVKLLASLLKKYAGSARGLVVGPSIGMDAAVLEINGTLIAAKSDPVTFVSDNSGEYAVYVNANDIAVMGGAPKWFLASVLLPEGKATARTAAKIFRQVNSACNEVGAVLCGGHTEVTPGVSRPIVTGHMLGTFKGRKIITSAGAKKGDALILTKGIAIEATSVIARELPEELSKAFSQTFINRCARYFKDPGISVVKDAADRHEKRPNKRHARPDGRGPVGGPSRALDCLRLLDHRRKGAHRGPAGIESAVRLFRHRPVGRDIFRRAPHLSAFFTGRKGN